MMSQATAKGGSENEPLQSRDGESPYTDFNSFVKMETIKIMKHGEEHICYNLDDIREALSLRSNSKFIKYIKTNYDKQLKNRRGYVSGAMIRKAVYSADVDSEERRRILSILKSAIPKVFERGAHYRLDKTTEENRLSKPTKSKPEGELLNKQMAEMTEMAELVNGAMQALQEIISRLKQQPGDKSKISKEDYGDCRFISEVAPLLGMTENEVKAEVKRHGWVELKRTTANNYRSWNNVSDLKITDRAKWFLVEEISAYYKNGWPIKQLAVTFDGFVYLDTHRLQSSLFD